MADSLLESGALSAFCGNMATMIAAGIDVDEAARMLSQDPADSYFRNTCKKVYGHLLEGYSLSDAMAATGAFPDETCQLIAIGETSGHLDNALSNLERYYDEEDRLFQKARASVRYPAAILLLMCVVLAFTAFVILPVFVDVCNSMVGAMSSGALLAVDIASIIGYVALGVTALCTLAVVWASIAMRNESGRMKILARFEGFGATKKALYQLAVSRFTMALSVYLSAGLTEEDALGKAMRIVRHKELSHRLDATLATMNDMNDPHGLAQALATNEVFEPIYARMLLAGSATGRLDASLSHFADLFFDDAMNQIDAFLDLIEPALAAFLTIAVGATLVSVMLPLIGVMLSIG